MMLRPIVDFVPEASPCCYYFVVVQVVYFQVAYSYYYSDQEVGAYYYPLHVAVHLVAVAYPPLAVDLLLVVAAFLPLLVEAALHYYLEEDLRIVVVVRAEVENCSFFCILLLLYNFYKFQVYY